MTEKTGSRPMRVHKNLFLQQLAAHPEDVREMFPSYEGTAEECAAELRKHPGEWFVRGELLTEAEAKAKYPTR